MSVPLDVVAAVQQIGSALIQENTRRGVAKANRSVDVARAAAQNQVRGASNQRAAAQAGLSRTLQSLNNARFVRGREDAIARAQAASAREQDAYRGNRLEGRLRAAEAAGEAQAAAAFSGVSGGLLDTTLAAQALQQQRMEARVRQDAEVSLFGAARAIGGAQGQIFSGQDTSVVNTSLDLTENSPGNAPYMPSTGAVLLQTMLDKDLLRPLVNYGASFFRPRAGTSNPSPMFADDTSVRRGSIDG